MASKKAERREASIAVLQEPAALESLCNHLASRGTLASWCTERGVLYRLAYEWLHDDKSRLATYARALEARHSAITDRVLDGLHTIADVDPRLAVDAKGRPLPLHKLPASVAMAMTGHEVTTVGPGVVNTKLRYAARDRAFESLGKHVGMFREKLEISGNLGLAGRIAAARQRRRPQQ